MTLRIWDTTLRDGEQAPGFALNKNQKVKVAEYLEEIGVNTIEAGCPANYNHDFESVRAVSKAVAGAEVAALARASEKDIELAAKALENARKPVILTFIPAYDKKLESIGLTPEEGIERATNAVRHARKYVDEVVFGAEFATKSDKEYLYRLLRETREAGATRLGIADTTGCANPESIEYLVKQITHSKVYDLHNGGDLAIHCHNDLGLAVANTLAAISGGASEAHVTAYGIGERAGNTSLEILIHALNVLYPDEKTNINNKALVENIRKIARIFNIPILPNAPLIGDNAFATAAGIHIKGRECYYEIDSEALYGVKPKVFTGPHSGSYKSGKRKKQPMD